MCLGIATFCIFNKGNGNFCTFVQKRRDDLVELPGFFHVVPAGTFQPLSVFDDADINAQFSFPFTILRELLEELYNLEEAEKSRIANPFNVFKMALTNELVKNFVPGEALVGKWSGNHPRLADKTDTY
jgi:hypothetical protein